MSPKQTYGMTSTEAAALYLSDGHTTDHELASMLDYAKKQPELLLPKGTIPMKDYEPPKLVIDDPDETERKALRDRIGFDVVVKIDLDKKRATFTDTELNLITRCKLYEHDQINGMNMASAMLRLKTKHDKATQ